MERNVQNVKEAVDTVFSFPEMMMRIFQYFFAMMQEVMRNETLTSEQKILYGSAVIVGFGLVSFISLWFVVFILRWVFRAVSRLFEGAARSLSDPASLLYIATLSIVRATPWYFNVLLLILFFCGILAVVSGNFWAESFKYVLGATVGSLIGVVKKKEEAEFDVELFDAARALSVKTAENRKYRQQPEITTTNESAVKSEDTSIELKQPNP